MTVITLTTDFGSGDHEAGVLKGVIWQIAPKAKIVDLSHDISRHNVMEAAILLWRASPYFPAGTIHVVVVDPGVGTSRRGIAAHLGDQFFVGPDNGIITLLMNKIEETGQISEFVKLDQPRFWLSTVSSVFHGRDVFSPVAAHLASGTPLSLLGTLISNPVRLDIPRPNRTRQGWIGQVIHIDHFGNLSTNINGNHLNQAGVLSFLINGEPITGLVSTFGDRPVGTLIALLDSSGSLAISVVNGSAAQFLHAGIGDNIEVIFQ
jgi:S-adenosylmethionine hydrolase